MTPRESLKEKIAAHVAIAQTAHASKAEQSAKIGVDMIMTEVDQYVLEIIGEYPRIPNNLTEEQRTQFRAIYARIDSQLVRASLLTKANRKGSEDE